MSEALEVVAARSVRARERIADLIYRTPLLPSRGVGEALGCDLRFKAENFQLTGSFKMRGAASRMTAMEPGSRLITASSGNHGIASARAASLTGQNLTVVLPTTVAEAKRSRIAGYGVEIIQHGEESGLSEKHAQDLAADGSWRYVSPYNDPEVIAGQGTIGLELLEQAERIDTIFVAMGGGGLISGIGSVLKSCRPGTRVYGVAAKNSDTLRASLEAGRVVETEHFETLADGIAGGMDEDSLTLPLAMEVVDEVVSCSEAEIAEAVRRLAQEEQMLVEGAAALALAGFLKVAGDLRGKTSVVVLCGANFDRAKILGLAAG